MSQAHSILVVGVLLGAALLAHGQQPYVINYPEQSTVLMQSGAPKPEPQVVQAYVRFWGQGEFLTWWMKDRPLPPLVTTSSTQESLGVLGQPGTSVLYGGKVDGDVRLGGRFSLGTDFVLNDGCNCPTVVGVEAVYFFLGEHNNPFTSSSTGNPVLARPFFDVTTGQQFSEQVANLQIGTVPPGPGARPGFARTFTGTVSVSNPSRIWGAELNAYLDRSDNTPERHGRWLIGFRHFGLEEDLRIREDLTLPATLDTTIAPAVVVLPETAISIIDEFRTRNYFYGPQLGYKSGLRHGPISLDISSKIGLGVMNQMVEIRGTNANMVRDPATGRFLAPTASQGGLLAQPTNIGRFERSRFCWLPETSVNLGCDLKPGCKVFVGYNFLYVSEVLRPGDQVDLGVDPRIRGGGLAPADATRPAFAFHSSDLWLQGITVGLDLRY